MINGNEYAFEDLQVVIQGRLLTGIRGVRYGATKTHTNVHGRGNVPVAMARGKKDASPAVLTVLQSEFEALQAATPAGKDPTDWAPFEMVVAYAPEGGVITIDIVPFCRVASWEKGITTDDDHMTIDLNLVTGIPRLNV